jgi:hypothetical protein
VPVLLVAAVAGYLLGGCGGGDLGGLTSLSGATDLPIGSRPILTGTRPDLTVPTLPPRTETETAEETTSGSTTTEPEPPEATTESTTTEPPPTTTEPPPTSPTTTAADTGENETVAVEPTSSESETPWGWIALGIGLAGAAVVGLVAWRRRRGGAAG